VGQSRRRSAKRILLVEDDADVRPFLELALSSAGYEVDATRTVGEAAARLGAARYALLLTDLRLPDGDGLSLAHAAREREIDVIILSGYILQASSADADRFDLVMKPVRPTELVDIVRRKIGAAT
jgi:two-component system response regulator PilR (NtrC family)